MRSISPGIITQIESGEIRAFVGVSLDINAGYFFTNCDVDIWYSGDRYTPRNMQPGSYTYSVGKIVDQATISIDNTDDAMTSDLMTQTVQGVDVVVYGFYLDSSNAIIGTPVTLFQGLLDDWELSEGIVQITISNIISQWNQRTFNQHQTSCRWKVFKSTYCGYAGGETTCNRSYTRCVELGNEANFGGFRWLPSIERADIWWGAFNPVPAKRDAGLG